MNKDKGWIIVDFDCYHGCNNPEFNPGCDESSIRIRINMEMNDRFKLFKKYMRIPCPRCGKVEEQKRSGWWQADTEHAKLEDYDRSTFLPSGVQDYTAQLMIAKAVELTREIETSKEHIRSLKKSVEAIGKTAYISR